jgi:hypothetical protein
MPLKSMAWDALKTMGVISAVPCGTETIFLRLPATPWLATFRRRFATTDETYPSIKQFNDSLTCLS